MFDPKKRISVEDSLKHPYLRSLHSEEDEPTTDPVSAFDFDYEIFDLSKDDLKNLIYEEIMLYHEDEALKQYMKNKRDFPDGMLHLRYAAKLISEKKKHEDA